ncbi:MAG: serine acetyltransferase [Spirochaetes bacterium]|nr:serine acetyltransferase [Spirochaetota bacterium]
MKNNMEILIDRILESYVTIGGMNHLEGHNLPSRQSIIRIVDDLESVLFPGFRDEESLNRSNYRYIISNKIAGVAERLQEELSKSLCYFNGNTKKKTDNGNSDIRAEKIVLKLLKIFPDIRQIIKSDVEAAFMGDPAAKSHEEVILSYPGMEAILVHRIAHELWIEGAPLIPRIMSEYIHGKTGIDIHPGARIGKYFFIDHGTGVVIGETTVIGDRVKIYQGVTLGALSVKKALGNKKRHPTIEDNVTIYAGATILGGNTIIGRGSVVGGNVWLVSSIPPNSKIYNKPGHYTLKSNAEKIQDFQI